MKKFLLTSVLFLLLSLVAVVIVFVLVIWFTATPSDEAVSRPAAEPELVPSEPATSAATTTPNVANTASVATTTTDAGIPLRDLPLSPSQVETLQTIGIDTESFVLTAAMVDCAESVLSVERVQEIRDGAAPTLFEVARLSPCLVAE